MDHGTICFIIDGPIREAAGFMVPPTPPTPVADQGTHSKVP